MTEKPIINIIVGSTRKDRTTLIAARWIQKEAALYNNVYQYNILDLKEYNLPFYGESDYSDYQERVSRWEKAIANSSAIIVVSPEYNHSIPGVLKNALDFGFVHWKHKPVSMAVLGFASAGARAGEHLRQILGALGTLNTRDQLLFSLYYDVNTEKIFMPRDLHKKALADILDELYYFVEMKAAVTKQEFKPPLDANPIK